MNQDKDHMTIDRTASAALRRFVPALSLLIALIALLHIVAMRFNLYFTLWWFDLVLHFLGGLWCSLFVLFYASVFWDGVWEKRGWCRMFLVGVSASFIVGVIWELYEYFFGFIFTTKSNYVLDMIL